MFSLYTWRRVYTFFQRNPLAVGLLVFIFAFSLATWIQFNNAFPDPDSFYHARMATLIRDEGLPKSFPWLPYTSLATTYIDQHYLYHVFLIPFVSVVDPLAGIKVATVLLTAVMATAFYGLLRTWRVRGAMLVTLLLLCVNPFMFRMSLAKTPNLAVAMLLVGLWLLFSFRNRWLFFFAWFYVWVYGGFSLLLVAAACFALAGEVHAWFRRRHERTWPVSRWIAELREAPAPRLGRYLHGFAAVILGVAAGLVVNPQFPTNVRFYEAQLVKIGIINYQNTIGVGGEWYPYKAAELLPGTVFASILVLLGLAALIGAAKRQSVRSWTLGLLTVFLLAFTLKSRRYVEYYVPIAMAFGAFALSDAWSSRALRDLTKEFRDLWRSRPWVKVVSMLVVLYLAVGIVGVAIRDLRGVQRDIAGGLPAHSLEGAATWIRQHAQPGEVVLHSDWDEFPLLFYYNPDQRYIAGLDATFFYDQDPDRYWKWVKLTSGQTKASEVYTQLRVDFDASYVLLTKDHVSMDAMLAGTPGLRLRYEDTQAKVYSFAD